jgi:hypothetical protein
MLGFLTVGALKIVKQLFICQRQRAVYRHTVLYEQRPNRIDKTIFCLFSSDLSKKGENKRITTYFLMELLP